MCTIGTETACALFDQQYYSSYTHLIVAHCPQTAAIFSTVCQHCFQRGRWVQQLLLWNLLCLFALRPWLVSLTPWPQYLRRLGQATWQLREYVFGMFVLLESLFEAWAHSHRASKCT